MAASRSLLAPCVLACAALALYLACVAPTVLWGDDAEMQCSLVTGETAGGGHAHPLWLTLASVVTRIVPGSPALRANVFSALCAAAAVGAAALAVFVLTGSAAAAVLAGGALAVSHTFWLHAERAEVYALYMALLAATLALLLAWRNGGPSLLLWLAGATAGLAYGAHPLILTALPGLAWLVASASRPHRGRDGIAAALACAAGAAAFLHATLAASPQDVSVVDAAGGALRALLHTGPHDVALWLGFLVYQFPLALPLAALGCAALWQRDRAAALGLLAVYAGCVVFALGFHVADQYVFFVPSYLVIGVWVGVGAQALLEAARPARRRVGLAALALAIVAAPPAAYWVTAHALSASHSAILPQRTLPYRDNALFFLWPPKTGYDGARRYVDAVVEALPPGASIACDWLPYQTIRYAQLVEKRRPDLLVACVPPADGNQYRWLVEQARTRRIFLADDEPLPYYDRARIHRTFDVRPYGVVYELRPRDAIAR